MHHILGPLLAANRNQMGLTLNALSQMAGISVPTLRNLERGKGNIGSYLSCLRGLKLELRWAGVPEYCHGRALANRRSRAGLSQRNAAVRLKVSHRTIIALETRFKGRIDTLDAYLSLLRLKPRVISAERTGHNADHVDTLYPRLAYVLDAGGGDAPRFELVCGDALQVLRSLPSGIADCVITSPPYWQQRSYAAGGIGEEHTVEAYLKQLRAVFRQVYRVLTPSASLWLNIDDSYADGSMQGIPWRLVLGMVEDEGWIVTNDNIWSKTGGSLNRAEDRHTHRHEHMFHMVKQRNYHFDSDAVRLPPAEGRRDGDEMISATGLSKAYCYQRIEGAYGMTHTQRLRAREAIDGVFAELEAGTLHDFRLILKGENRVTHSDDEKVSARASRLERDGYYILKYNPKGSMPSDVWRIAPDRSKGRANHYAAFPEQLVEVPLKATCPVGGIVVDPFVGTGTTLAAAQRLGRHGVGIDLSDDYLQIARERIGINT